jgi:16S rRNA (guanine527-N7)-methyltransferase
MSGASGLERALGTLGLALSTVQTERFGRYLDLLEKWNRVYNQTAIRDRERVVTHHLLDSLAILPHLKAPRVLDVGSGAGFPGVPLAIANGELRLTLLDSNHKKTAFLRQAVAELGLKNAVVESERVEAWRTSALFETIVSRAFSELGEFVTASARLLAPGGILAAMKGVYRREEVERMPAGFEVVNVLKLAVPGLDAERHLVVVAVA